MQPWPANRDWRAPPVEGKARNLAARRLAAQCPQILMATYWLLEGWANIVASMSMGFGRDGWGRIS